MGERNPELLDDTVAVHLVRVLAEEEGNIAELAQDRPLGTDGMAAPKDCLDLLPWFERELATMRTFLEEAAWMVG